MKKNPSKWVAIEPVGLRVGKAPRGAVHAFMQLVTTEPIATELFNFFVREAGLNPQLVPPMRGQLPLGLLIDRGGIAMADRQVYEWKLDGLPITAAAIDLEECRDALLAREPEHVGADGHDFYTVPTRHWNLVLTLKQWAWLLTKMDSVMPEAMAISAIETEEFNRRMTEPHPHLAIKQRPVKRRPESA